MFPPLCFVDETKNVVDSETLQSNLNDVKADKKIEEEKKEENVEDKDTENKEVQNDDEESSNNKVIFKSKLFEVVGDLFK